MISNLSRRKFLQHSSLLSLGAALQPIEAVAMNLRRSVAEERLLKACCIGVLPRELSVLDRFKLAADLGFEGIEPNTLETTEEVREYREAARATGVKIHSIMNSGHWRHPLTDNDPGVVAQCIQGIKTSMRNARDLGADAVLLVPGIVTSSVRYGDVYERSQKQIRALLPLAEELGVVIAIENVGNRFLLSPLEFARYVDEFDSPYVRAYFDVGNITSIGFPQDWIRTLGSRLMKVHIKKFQPGVDHPTFDPNDRRTQGIDWPDVVRALHEVGFAGWVTAEVRSGDDGYLRELSSRMDSILAGNSPV
jgi:hexulose-6-phosphate isomerase